jgi:hypothetical protein
MIGPTHAETASLDHHRRVDWVNIRGWLLQSARQSGARSATPRRRIVARIVGLSTVLAVALLGPILK